MTLNAKIGGFTKFFRDIGLRKSISFTRRRHRRQRHTRLWPMRIMVPMGRVQVICDFRNYNYWTGNAIGFRASRELCSNFLLPLDLRVSWVVTTLRTVNVTPYCNFNCGLCGYDSVVASDCYRVSLRNFGAYSVVINGSSYTADCYWLQPCENCATSAHRRGWMIAVQMSGVRGQHAVRSAGSYDHPNGYTLQYY